MLILLLLLWVQLGGKRVSISFYPPLPAHNCCQKEPLMLLPGVQDTATVLSPHPPTPKSPTPEKAINCHCQAGGKMLFVLCTVCVCEIIFSAHGLLQVKQHSAIQPSLLPWRKNYISQQAKHRKESLLGLQASYGPWWEMESRSLSGFT